MARLATWTTNNGYNYACGNTAQRAVQNIEFEDLPACVMWPQAETVIQRYGQNVCEMIVKVEALAAAASTANPSVIQEKLLGDVIKIMTDPSVVVTALVENILYTEGGPAGIAKPEEKVTAVYAKFKIEYATLIGNPYSQ
jgi:hypothetical protein